MLTDDEENEEVVEKIDNDIICLDDDDENVEYESSQYNYSNQRQEQEELDIFLHSNVKQEQCEDPLDFGNHDVEVKIEYDNEEDRIRSETWSGYLPILIESDEDEVAHDECPMDEHSANGMAERLSNVNESVVSLTQQLIDITGDTSASISADKPTTLVVSTDIEFGPSTSANGIAKEKIQPAMNSTRNAVFNDDLQSLGITVKNKTSDVSSTDKERHQKKSTSREDQQVKSRNSSSSRTRRKHESPKKHKSYHDRSDRSRDRHHSSHKTSKAEHSSRKRKKSESNSDHNRDHRSAKSVSASSSGSGFSNTNKADKINEQNRANNIPRTAKLILPQPLTKRQARQSRSSSNDSPSSSNRSRSSSKRPRKENENTVNEPIQQHITESADFQKQANRESRMINVKTKVTWRNRGAYLAETVESTKSKAKTEMVKKVSEKPISTKSVTSEDPAIPSIQKSTVADTNTSSDPENDADLQLFIESNIEKEIHPQTIATVTERISTPIGIVNEDNNVFKIPKLQPTFVPVELDATKKSAPPVDPRISRSNYCKENMQLSKTKFGMPSTSAQRTDNPFANNSNAFTNHAGQTYNNANSVYSFKLDSATYDLLLELTKISPNWLDDASNTPPEINGKDAILYSMTEDYSSINEFQKLVIILNII